MKTLSDTWEFSLRHSFALQNSQESLDHTCGSTAGAGEPAPGAEKLVMSMEILQKKTQKSAPPLDFF